jgi:hypothetical protein
MRTQAVSLVIAFEGGSEKRGGGRREGGGEERGGSKHVLVLNAVICTYFSLHLSFLYLHSAVATSLDIKKFHRNDTAVISSPHMEAKTSNYKQLP